MILLILVFSFILRVVNLNQSLWFDESINVLAAKDLGFWQFVTGYPIGDFHPPLYFGLLWIWSHLFGFSEIAVRMPSVILGVGTVFLTYLIGKELFNKKTGLIAATILALGPLHVYYSQEARMYSLAAFAVSLSFYYLIKFLQSNKFFWFYVVSVLLVFYSDYLPYLAILAQLIYVVVFERKYIKKLLFGQLIAVVGFIPWLFVFPSQLINGRETALNVPGWAKVVGGSNIKNVLLIFVKALVGRVSLDNKLIYGFIVLAMGLIYGYLISYALKRNEKRGYLIFCWVFIPVFLAFLVSYFIPVLFYFRMLFILPGIYLLIAYALSIINSKLSKIFLTIILIFSLVCLLAYYVFPKYQREDWKGLVSFLNKNSNNQTLTLFENDNLIAPYRYYKIPINAEGALNKFPADSSYDVKKFDYSFYNKIYLVDYLVEISDPKRVVDKALVQDGWSVIQTFNFNGVGFVYEYVRK